MTSHDASTQLQDILRNTVGKWAHEDPQQSPHKCQDLSWLQTLGAKWSTSVQLKKINTFTLHFLPPIIIMESWKSKMGPSDSSYLSNIAVFHFHDYLRKSLWHHTMLPVSSKILRFEKHCGQMGSQRPTAISAQMPTSFLAKKSPATLLSSDHSISLVCYWWFLFCISYFIGLKMESTWNNLENWRNPASPRGNIFRVDFLM